VSARANADSADFRDSQGPTPIHRRQRFFRAYRKKTVLAVVKSVNSVKSVLALVAHTSSTMTRRTWNDTSSRRVRIEGSAAVRAMLQRPGDAGRQR
jgi:hypothetical protein